MSGSEGGDGRRTGTDDEGIPATTGPSRIFVYGTLKRGWNLAHLLHRQRYLGIARTEPRYRLLDTGDCYPALVESVPGRPVEGEVWRIDAECLGILDEEEGIAEGLYARRSIALLPPFDRIPVEAYFFLRPIEGLRDLGDRW